MVAFFSAKPLRSRGPRFAFFSCGASGAGDSLGTGYSLGPLGADWPLGTLRTLRPHGTLRTFLGLVAASRKRKEDKQR